jgi:hypothetical protein
MVGIKKIFTGKNGLYSELQQLRRKLATYEKGWPPGHFYSPIASVEQVAQREEIIWGESQKILPGISLQEEQQVALLSALSTYYSLQPWEDEKKKNLRFHFNNPNFSYGESITLFGMMMHLKPKKIIEIGSGFSSCVILDTNELFFQNSISTTFIEPFPQLFYSLIKNSDRQNIHVVGENLQNVDTSVFKSLSAGDFLVIDSTHVSKIDSDVNHILFTILPLLESGVYIHFHDIYFPFEYPKEWIYQGRSWNEAYILRAFLQYNKQFEIIFFNSMVGDLFRPELEAKMPLCVKNAGSSLWLKKL